MHEEHSCSAAARSSNDGLGRARRRPLHRPASPDLHGAQLEQFSLGKCIVGSVDFPDTEFLGEARFWAAQFEGRQSIFKGAIFRGPANFSSTTFKMYLDFSNIEFWDRVDFENSGLDSFDDSVFHGSLDLSELNVATFTVRRSEFVEPVSIIYGDVRNIIAFEDCVFHARVKITHARSDTKFSCAVLPLTTALILTISPRRYDWVEDKQGYL
jgi:hypothetical protein